jgi:hypothetical protein
LDRRRRGADPKQSHKGRAYNEAFSKWLGTNTLVLPDKNGKDRTVSFATIDTGTRSRLADLLDNRAAVEAWRSSLALGERLHLNHPNGVWRKWQASKTGKAAQAASRAKGKHENEIARLKADNERLRAEGGNLFTAKSSVDDILKLLIDTVSSRKFAELIKRGFELAIEYDYLSKEAAEQAKEDAKAKLKDKLLHRD